MLDLVQKVNIALSEAWCVIRGDKVCVESEKPLEDSVATFEYIKNYVYQDQSW